MPLGAVTVWDGARGWPCSPNSPNTSEVDLPAGTTATFNSGRSNCIYLLAPLTGQRVLVRHIIMASHALHCLNCKNVIIAGVKVTSAPGMAFVFENGGSNLTLRNNTV